METKTVEISVDIHKKIEDKLRDPLTGFDRVEEYIEFILKKALEIDTDDYENTTKSEDELVEDKLRQLGYI